MPRRVGPDMERDPAYFIPPMLAVTQPEPFDHPGWWYEFKWDGYRAIVSQTDTLRIFSRRGYDLLSRFPELAALKHHLPRPLVLDVEIVAWTSNGPSFAALGRKSAESRRMVVAFDCLYSEGEWRLDCSQRERRRLLEHVVPSAGPILVAPGVAGRGRSLLDQARRWGFEGVMAKREDSRYHPGLRVTSWQKFLLYQTEVFAVSAARRTPTGWRWRLVEPAGLVVADIAAPGGWPANGENGDPGQGWLAPTAPVYCIVSYREKTSNGRLRHPVVRSWRTEKNPGG